MRFCPGYSLVTLLHLILYNIKPFLSIKILQIIPQLGTKFAPHIYKKCTNLKRLPTYLFHKKGTLRLEAFLWLLIIIVYDYLPTYSPFWITATMADLLGSPSAVKLMEPVAPSTVIFVIAPIRASLEISPPVVSISALITYTPS